MDFSNTGGEAIKQYVYDERHRQRRNLTMKELEEVVQRVVYKEDGRFKTRTSIHYAVL